MSTQQLLHKGEALQSQLEEERKKKEEEGLKGVGFVRLMDHSTRSRQVVNIFVAQQHQGCVLQARDNTRHRCDGLNSMFRVRQDGKAYQL